MYIHPSECRNAGDALGSVLKTTLDNSKVFAGRTFKKVINTSFSLYNTLIFGFSPSHKIEIKDKKIKLGNGGSEENCTFLFARSLEDSKKILKLMTNDPNLFHKREVPSGLNSKENLFSVETREVLKKLRAPFSTLLGTKKSRENVRKIIYFELNRLKEYLVEDKYWGTFIKRIVSAILTDGSDTVNQKKLIELINKSGSSLRLTSKQIDACTNILEAGRKAKLDENQIADLINDFVNTALTNSYQLLNAVIRLAKQNPNILLNINTLLKSDLEEDKLKGRDLVLAFIAESLRIRPVLPRITRNLNPDKIIGSGYTKCPVKHARLVIDTDMMTRSVDVAGENPMQFSLDRPYLAKGLTSIRDLPFLPFGSGVQQCPAWWLNQTIAEQVVEMLAEHEAQIRVS